MDRARNLDATAAKTHRSDAARMAAKFLVAIDAVLTSPIRSTVEDMMSRNGLHFDVDWNCFFISGSDII
jgi:phosphohistidine phosphatase SixA